MKLTAASALCFLSFCHSLVLARPARPVEELSASNPGAAHDSSLNYRSYSDNNGGWDDHGGWVDRDGDGVDDYSGNCENYDDGEQWTDGNGNRRNYDWKGVEEFERQRLWYTALSEQEKEELSQLSSQFHEFQSRLLAKYPVHYCAHNATNCDRQCAYYFNEELLDAFKGYCLDRTGDDGDYGLYFHYTSELLRFEKQMDCKYFCKRDYGSSHVFW